MKNLAFLLLALMLLDCSGNKPFYTLDDAFLQDLEYQKEQDENSGFIEGESSYFSFSNELDDTGDDDPNQINFLSLTDKGQMAPNVCGCMVRNDTITLAGGIFWGEEGMGYMVKVYQNGFDGQVITGSASGYKTKDLQPSEEGLYLKSEKQQLWLAEAPVFEPDRAFKGKVTMTTIPFYRAIDNAPKEDRLTMTVLFECILDDDIVF